MPLGSSDGELVTRLNCEPNRCLQPCLHNNNNNNNNKSSKKSRAVREREREREREARKESNADKTGQKGRAVRRRRDIGNSPIINQLRAPSIRARTCLDCRATLFLDVLHRAARRGEARRGAVPVSRPVGPRGWWPGSSGASGGLDRFGSVQFGSFLPTGLPPTGRPIFSCQSATHIRPVMAALVSH